jgi:large subunit ribosomal protein L25
MSISLQAQTRADVGKGASRRLRRLEAKVPAVLYGGDKEAVSLVLENKLVIKALEHESAYSSVLDLFIDGAKKPERVVLKALQRHPYKPHIMHMDLQRVSATDVLVKMVPIHFVNEEKAPGLNAGGVINHTMTQVEVRCEVRYLPEFIELDLSGLELNQVLHLTDLKLPKGVQLALDPTTGGHNHPVVSIHLSKAELSEELAEEEVSEEEITEEHTEESSSEDDAKESE